TQCARAQQAGARSGQGPEAAEAAQRLEAELRRSKRREEKLQALQFRLREDVRESGGDLAAFDALKKLRETEYELDRAGAAAAREAKALREQLAKAQAGLKAAPGAGGKENALPC
ncbi:hypothetical protein H632_c4569p0, partial [Helicosporidium sp. ATCC 50920]